MRFTSLLVLFFIATYTHAGNETNHNSQRPASANTSQSDKHWLPLEGGKNLRDLGGYTTSDGLQVKKGKIFRSGALTDLTEKDQQMLNNYKISTIVDFRSPPERVAEPTRWAAGAMEILTWDTGLDMSDIGSVFRDPELTASKLEAHMAKMYPTILHSMDQQYTTLFDRLASSDQALLFHCTAGKDRTGIAAALILSVLGVDKETIINDFMLSDVYYSTMTDGMRALGATAKSQPDKGSSHGSSGADLDRARDIMSSISPEVLGPIIGVRKSYLEAVFNVMEEKSGSTLAYIQNELDVTDEEINKLRAFYLEPST